MCCSKTGLKYYICILKSLNTTYCSYHKTKVMKKHNCVKNKKVKKPHPLLNHREIFSLSTLFAFLSFLTCLAKW